MMQPQMCQPDQLSQQPVAQQMSQQMVLCPVKVVYETQILVPPGEQIQPNQTIFINPQNTPPWIQNRMQNQVFYVQQMPNNIVPNMQQNIDPNQMYIQSYPYQMTQQIVTQNPQEQRQMQLQNMPQQYSVMQPVPNVGTNIQERTVQMTNFCQMPNQIVPNRQIAPNIGVSVPNQQQPINEVQRTFMNVRPQIHQYLSNVRPQVMSNHNIVTQNVGQTFSTIPPRPIQISNQNISSMHRMATTSLPNTPPRLNAPTFATPNPVQMAPKLVETVTNTNIVPRHSIANTVPKVTNIQSYTIKTVQPRPQYRHNVPNIGKLIQPTPHVNANVYKDRVPNIPVSVESPQFNRKRKSESPDEVYKKMVVNPASRDNNTQTNNTKQTSNNTQKNILKENAILQISNSGAQLMKLNEPVTTNTTSIASQTEKEKLLRNTVFTQAKGRVLSDKEIVPKEAIKTDIKSDKETLVKSEHSITIVKLENSDEKECKVEKEYIKKENVNEETPEQKEPEIKIQVQEQKIEFKEKLLDGHQILTHVLDGYVIQESNVAFPIRKPLKEKTLSNNGKEIKEEGVDTKESAKDRIPIDLPLLPFHFLQLHNEGKHESSAKEEEEEKEENPFMKLQKAVVKSWTVDQLANYISKNNWSESASVFRDHEIDGESLFLVSKAQLIHIGISEEHANVICEFVRN